MTPKLSLVTGKVGRDESFARLVDSVIRHTVADWEMVVSDASEVPYQTTDSRIRVIHEKPRKGHTRGYNDAFRASRGEFVLWLNDDAEVCEGYDTAAIGFMEAYPQIGLGCLHYSEDGGPFHFNSAWSVPYANFGILRREVGNEIGWFDEDLTMYGADNSLALKILLSKRGVADIPAARVIHHSVKDQIRVENQQKRQADNQRLQDKYMPLRKVWQTNYLRYKVETGSTPWAHGRKPEMVTK